MRHELRLPIPTSTVRASAVAALAALALAGCGSGPTGPEAAVEPDVEVRLAALVNEHRASLGCPRLAGHGVVAQVARRHSQDMAGRGFFGHVNPDGETPFDRLRAAGVTWERGAAENIARGRKSAEAIFSAWLASPTHRASIERCEYTHQGVGVAQGFWTHLFVGEPSS